MKLIKEILKYSLITILILFFLLVAVQGLFTWAVCEDNPNKVGLITLKTYKAFSFANKVLVFDLVIKESSERLISIRVANSLAI